MGHLAREDAMPWGTLIGANVAVLTQQHKDVYLYTNLGSSSFMETL